MTFVLLGVDNQALALARALLAGDQHELLWYYVGSEPFAVSSQAASSLRALAPMAEVGDGWQSRVLSEMPDVAIVAFHPDAQELLESVRYVRQVLPAASSIVLVLPLTLSVMAHYEIEVLMTDLQLTMLPYHAASWSALFVQLRDHCRAGSELGQIERIEMQRGVPRREADILLRQFSHDVVLLRQLAGELNRVAALGTGDPSTAPSQLNVQMSGPDGVLTGWSIDPTAATRDGRITVTGSAGVAELLMPQQQPWQLQVNGELVAAPGERDEVESAGAANDLQRRIGAARQHATAVPDWRDATRSAELTEALEKSLRKGRVIQLNFEDRGEESAFKGMMASVGCGLLILGLVLMVVTAMILKIARWRGLDGVAAVIGRFPYLLLGLLVVFLVLQLLRFVIPPRRNDGSERGK